MVESPATDMLYAQTTDLAYSLLDRAAHGGTLKDLPMRVLVKQLTASLRHSPDLLSYFDRSPECHFFVSHTVSTCLLTLAMGQALAVEEEAMEQLGQCALLYDVGLSQLSDRPASADGSRSHLFDDFKRHPALSAACLRAMDVRLERAYVVAEQHHERLDGSGYPRALTGAHIDLWAQVVGLADLYASFVHRRSKRQHQPPQSHDLLRELVTHEELFDRRVIKALLSQVSLYPVGTWVQLDNGAVGRVCAVNTGASMQPIVTIYYERGQRLETPRAVNLRDVRGLCISRVTRPLTEHALA